MKRVSFSRVGLIFVAVMLAALYPSDLMTAVLGMLMMLLTLTAPFYVPLCMGLVSFVVFMLFWGPASAGGYCLGFLLMGFAGGWLIRRRRPFVEVVGAAALGVFCSKLLLYNTAAQNAGKTIVGFLTEAPLAAMTDTFHQLADSLSVPDLAGELEAVLAGISNIVQSLVPGYFILTALGTAFVAVCLAKPFVNRAGLADNSWRFSLLRCHPFAVGLYLVSMGALFFTDGMLFIIALNLVLIMTFVLALCGLSLIDFLLLRRLSRGAKWLVIAAAFFALSGLGMLFVFANPVFLLAVLGVIDSFANFRKV